MHAEWVVRYGKRQLDTLRVPTIAHPGCQWTAGTTYDGRHDRIARFRRVTRGVHYVRVAPSGGKQQDCGSVVARPKDELVRRKNQRRQMGNRLMQTRDKVTRRYRPAGPDDDERVRSETANELENRLQVVFLRPGECVSKPALAHTQNFSCLRYWLLVLTLSIAEGWGSSCSTKK